MGEGNPGEEGLSINYQFPRRFSAGSNRRSVPWRAGGVIRRQAMAPFFTSTLPPEVPRIHSMRSEKSGSWPTMATRLKSRNAASSCSAVSGCHAAGQPALDDGARAFPRSRRIHPPSGGRGPAGWSARCPAAASARFKQLGRPARLLAAFFDQCPRAVAVRD